MSGVVESGAEAAAGTGTRCLVRRFVAEEFGGGYKCRLACVGRLILLSL